MALTLALARALDAAPPQRLGVEVVLQGASDGEMLGLGRYLRARRGHRRAANTIVLGIAPCGAGEPRFWISDGSSIPLRYSRRLRQIAQRTAGSSSQPGAARHRGRGTSPAYPARLAGVPAIDIGCLDRDGLAPRSHQPTDLPAALDRGCTDGLLELALTLVDAIDADLARAATDTSAASRTAA